MRKRAFQIRLVKDPKEPTTSGETEETVIEKLITSESIHDTAVLIMKCLAFYVALDTGRKVMIALAEK